MCRAAFERVFFSVDWRWLRQGGKATSAFEWRLSLGFQLGGITCRTTLTHWIVIVMNGNVPCNVQQPKCPDQDYLWTPLYNQFNKCTSTPLRLSWLVRYAWKCDLLPCPESARLYDQYTAVPTACTYPSCCIDCAVILTSKLNTVGCQWGWLLTVTVRPAEYSEIVGSEHSMTWLSHDPRV